jgi:hypothetical protein
MTVEPARVMGQKPSAREHPRVTFLEAPESFEAAFIPMDQFSAGSEDFRRLHLFLGGWIDKLAAQHHLTASSWIQMTNLHQGDTAQQLSKNGARWRPELGLGVWPDREPPRLWTQADFQELSLGQPPPALMHTVFHLSKGDQAAKDAWEQLFGSGTLVYALLSTTAQEFHQTMTDELLPLIREEALRGYPFYMPLLDGKSLQTACGRHVGRQAKPVSPTETPLYKWMGVARFYVRESAEDKGLFILTSLPGAFDSLRNWLAKPMEREVRSS